MERDAALAQASLRAGTSSMPGSVYRLDSSDVTEQRLRVAACTTPCIQITSVQAYRRVGEAAYDDLGPDRLLVCRSCGFVRECS